MDKKGKVILKPTTDMIGCRNDSIIITRGYTFFSEGTQTYETNILDRKTFKPIGKWEKHTVTNERYRPRYESRYDRAVGGKAPHIDSSGTDIYKFTKDGKEWK